MLSSVRLGLANAEHHTDALFRLWLGHTKSEYHCSNCVMTSHKQYVSQM